MIIRRTEELELSPKGERKLSGFIAEELLYDHLTHRLDPEREKAITEYLQNNPQFRDKFNLLQYGLTYAKNLKQAELSAETMAQLSSPPTYAAEVLKRMRVDRWPSWLKWSTEAFLLGGLISALASLMPWNKIIAKFEEPKRIEMILAEVNAQKNNKNSSSEIYGNPQDTPSNPEIPLYADEGKGIALPTKEQKQVPFVERIMQLHQPVAQYPTPMVAPRSGRNTDVHNTEVSTKTPTVTTKPAPVAATTTAAPAAAPASPAAAPATTMGVLYRGSLHVANLGPSSQKLIRVIEDLGGRKAGDVPLGWKKDQETYFHFTVPTAKLETLISELKTYGVLKYSKEKHSRIMPEGISRFIISIYEIKQLTKEKLNTAAPATPTDDAGPDSSTGSDTPPDSNPGAGVDSSVPKNGESAQ